MQLWIPSALAIYLASYLPLSVILMAQDIDLSAVSHGVCAVSEVRNWNCASPLLHPVASSSLVLLCGVCMLISLFALKIIPTKTKIIALESKHIPADLINYVVPYILSFVSLSFDDKTKMIGFLIFLAWIFWITFKSGQIVMNPVLAVLGWKLYEVKYSYAGSKDVFTGRILSTVEIVPSQTYKQGSLQDVLIVKS